MGLSSKWDEVWKCYENTPGVASIVGSFTRRRRVGEFPTIAAQLVARAWGIGGG